MSTRRQAMGAREAYEDHVREYPSEGTWAITVGETQAVRSTAHGDCVVLRAYDDAHLPEYPPHHASVHFHAALSRGQREKISKTLRDHAVARGRLHPKG